MPLFLPLFCFCNDQPWSRGFSAKLSFLYFLAVRFWLDVRLTVITAARRNGRVPIRPQGRCSPRPYWIAALVVRGRFDPTPDVIHERCAATALPAVADAGTGGGDGAGASDAQRHQGSARISPRRQPTSASTAARHPETHRRQQWTHHVR